MSQIPLPNASLHPSFFEQNNIPSFEPRTISSVNYERSIPMDFSKKQKSFRKYAESTKRENWASEILRGNQEITPTAYQFFSRENVDYLQKAIIYYVRKQSGHKISEQDETALLAIMKTIYIEYSRNSYSRDPKIIKKLVDRLNMFVLETAVPEIISEVEMYLTYLRDASQNPMPLVQPVSMSIAGTRNLRDYSDLVLGIKQ